jgi:ATP adenylyltransferase
VTGRIREEGCIFCNRLACDESEQFVLHRGRNWYIILNHYPYNNGHLLLVLNRHQPALSDCTPDELAEMSELLQILESTLLRAFHPDGINCGYNGGTCAGAGVPEHFHFHMLPRWNGDTSFMTAIGDTRIMPQDLRGTYEQIKPVLAEVLAERG